MSDPPISWIAPGQSARVEDFDLSGAMVYMRSGGSGQPSSSHGPLAEPSLIDPTLPIHRTKSHSGLESYYLQAYRAFSPEDRADYLEWLAGGRRAPDARRSFIRLFMVGLERRLFVDIVTDPARTWEIPFIRSSVVALKETYRTRMYEGFADSLLEMVDHMEMRPVTVELPPPPLIGTFWDTPVDLKVGLGSFTAQRIPIPAGWAVAWSWFRPDVPLRTSAYRCTEEFAELFKIVYRAKYGDGITLRQGRRNSASSTLRSIPRSDQSIWTWATFRMSSSARVPVCNSGSLRTKPRCGSIPTVAGLPGTLTMPARWPPSRISLPNW